MRRISEIRPHWTRLLLLKLDSLHDGSPGSSMSSVSRGNARGNICVPQHGTSNLIRYTSIKVAVGIDHVRTGQTLGLPLERGTNRNRMRCQAMTWTNQCSNQISQRDGWMWMHRHAALIGVNPQQFQMLLARGPRCVPVLALVDTARECDKQAATRSI